MVWISDFFIEKMLKYGVVADCDKRIYAYGIRALIQKILFTLILFMAASMIHEILYTVVFYFSYIEVRGSYGSFHSKSRISCFWWTALICFLAYYMKKMVLDFVPIYMFLVLLSFFYLLLILIKHFRKPEQTLQKRGAFLYIIFFVFYALGFKTGFYGIFMAFFCTAMLECIHCLLITVSEKNRNF